MNNRTNDQIVKSHLAQTHTQTKSQICRKDEKVKCENYKKPNVQMLRNVKTEKRCIGRVINMLPSSDNTKSFANKIYNDLPRPLDPIIINAE